MLFVVFIYASSMRVLFADTIYNRKHSTDQLMNLSVSQCMAARFYRIGRVQIGSMLELLGRKAVQSEHGQPGQNLGSGLAGIGGNVSIRAHFIYPLDVQDGSDTDPGTDGLFNFKRDYWIGHF
jgi:hypothetical protein